MKTPSMVSAERILLRPIAWAAAARIIIPKVQNPGEPLDRGGARRRGGAGTVARGAQPATGLALRLRSSETISPSRIVTTRFA